MANYIDGFAVPIPRSQLEEYRRVVEAVAEIWKEHGALDYREYLGDDMTLEGTGSFVNMLGAGKDEVISFGWVAFESREARDKANKKVAADPRIEALMGGSATGFEPVRMAYAGFAAFVP